MKKSFGTLNSGSGNEVNISYDYNPHTKITKIYFNMSESNTLECELAAQKNDEYPVYNIKKCIGFTDAERSRLIKFLHRIHFNALLYVMEDI